MQIEEKLPRKIETMTTRDQFYEACNTNDLETAKTMFVKHGDMLKPVPLAILEGLSENGHLTMLRFLIEDCTQQHLVHTYGINRILSNAVKMGHPDIVRYLVERCQAGKHEVCWPTASIEAATIGDLETLKYLIDVGGIDGRRFALPVAARHGHLDIVKYLLKRYRFGPECLQAIDWVGSLDVVKVIADELAHSCEKYKQALYFATSDPQRDKPDAPAIEVFLKDKISQMENNLYYKLLDKMPGKEDMLFYARLNLFLAFVGYFVADTIFFTAYFLVLSVLGFISGSLFKERTNKLLALVAVLVVMVDLMIGFIDVFLLMDG